MCSILYEILKSYSVFLNFITENYKLSVYFRDIETTEKKKKVSFKNSTLKKLKIFIS